MTAATLGVVAGIAFAWLWLWVVPWSAHGRFFKDMVFETKQLVKTDDAGQFLALYKRLLTDTARYVGRNLAGTVVASVPAALLYLFVGEGGMTPFLAAFFISMMIVFGWPRLWPARPAF